MNNLILTLASIASALFVYIYINSIDTFVSNNDTFVSMEATDSAPSTTEVKVHYKTLLLYAHGDAGDKSMRLLGDFRDRVYGPRNFRKSFATNDIVANWPKWIPARNTDTGETVPTKDDAVTAELRILSYIQKNFPQEPGVGPQGSIVNNIIQDFGKRFVFEKEEEVRVKKDFLLVPLTRDWINPTA
jgi:hypothetical protein